MEIKTVYYKLIKCDLCNIFIAKTSSGVCKIDFDSCKSEFPAWISQNYPDYKIVEVENQLEPELEKQILEYFSGTRKNFDFKINIKLTDFQKKVFNCLLRVPYGSVVSYGDIAKRIGGVKYSRAVGNALNKNPLPIIVPCHRVVDSKGGIGGFSAGIEIKKKLLNLEKENEEGKILSI